MPVAQFDTSLFDQLMRAFATYPKDAVGIARVERVGRALMARDAAVAHQVIGACAAARGSTEEAKRHHEQAIRLAPHDDDAWSNFLVSLTILNDIDAVREKAAFIGEHYRSNSRLVKAALDSLVELGLLRSAARFIQMHDMSQHEACTSDWHQAIDSLLERHDVDEDDLAQAVAEVRHFLAEKGLTRPEYLCQYVEDDVGGSGEMAFSLHVHSSPDQAIALEGELFQYLAARHLAAEERGAITFYLGCCKEAPVNDVAAAS